MTNSTFYHDGYADAIDGNEPAPPYVTVYALEYMEGYTDAQSSALSQPAALEAVDSAISELLGE
jgi:hypothetical protein